MLSQFRSALTIFLVFTVLTGVVYPLSMTLFGYGLFTEKSKGSLIIVQGKAAGSALIGQPFDDAKYFWGRPSATGPMSYNAAASSGSNLSVGNPTQLEAIETRVKKLRDADPDNHAAVPGDLVTASGSGLDPHISPAAAHYQCDRVARVRKIDAYQLHQLIDRHTEGRQLGILGEPRVNVLKLNLALDNPNEPELSHSWKDPI